MTDSLHDRVLAYIDAHTTLNLATTGPGGLWAAAVLYVHEGTSIYFTSVPATRHGVNLAETRHAAGTINDDCTSWMSMKGVQLDGTVDPVDDVAERTRVVRAYLERFPFAGGMWPGRTDPDDIGADPGIHHFYKITPKLLLFTDNEHHPEGREELSMA